MAQVLIDQYAEAQCGCVFLPCGRSIILRPIQDFKKRHFRAGHSSTDSDFELFNPANAFYSPIRRTDETKCDGHEADNERDSGSDSDGPPTRQLAHPPTKRYHNDFPPGMSHRPLPIRSRQGTGHLPDLHDIRSTIPRGCPNIDVLANEDHDVGPSAAVGGRDIESLADVRLFRGDIPCNRAALDRRHRHTVVEQLIRQHGRSPTEQEIDAAFFTISDPFRSGSIHGGNDNLPDLLDIHGTMPHRYPNIDVIADEPADSTLELRLVSPGGVHRRRTHRRALETLENDPPSSHTRSRQHDDNSSPPAQPRFSGPLINENSTAPGTPGSTPGWQGFPRRGNHQRPLIEDASNSPRPRHGSGSHRLTTESSTATAGNLAHRRQQGTTRRDDRGGTGIRYPLRDISGNASLRGGGLEDETNANLGIDHIHNSTSNSSYSSANRTTGGTGGLSYTEAVKNRNPNERSYLSFSNLDAKNQNPNPGSYSSPSYTAACSYIAACERQAQTLPSDLLLATDHQTAVEPSSHRHDNYSNENDAPHEHTQTLRPPPIMRPIHMGDGQIHYLEIPRPPLPRRRNALPLLLAVNPYNIPTTRDLSRYETVTAPHPHVILSPPAERMGRGNGEGPDNDQGENPTSNPPCL